MVEERFSAAIFDEYGVLLDLFDDCLTYQEATEKALEFASQQSLKNGSFSVDKRFIISESL